MSAMIPTAPSMNATLPTPLSNTSAWYRNVSRDTSKTVQFIHLHFTKLNNHSWSASDCFSAGSYLCGVPPSVNIECVVLVVLWPTSEEQTNQIASLTPVLVVFQKRPLSYSYFGTICLGYPLPTVVPCQQLKLS